MTEEEFKNNLLVQLNNMIEWRVYATQKAASKNGCEINIGKVRDSAENEINSMSNMEFMKELLS